MTLSTYSTTNSISAWKRGWPLVRLSKRAADRASLTVAPTASQTIANQMSQQGLALLRERFDRLATATTPMSVRRFTSTPPKAEAIDYTREVP